MADLEQQGCICGYSSQATTKNTKAPPLWICPVHGKTGRLSLMAKFRDYQTQLKIQTGESTLWDIAYGIMRLEILKAAVKKKNFDSEEYVKLVDLHLQNALPRKMISIKLTKAEKKEISPKELPLWKQFLLKIILFGKH